MFVTMNRFAVRPEHRADFERRWRERESRLAEVPGFIRNSVLRPVEGAGEHYVVMTLWESRAAFERWVHSDAFRAAHARAAKTPKEWFAAPNRLEAFEAITDEVGAASRSEETRETGV
ncbi:MAG: antibiotic biosynthesis monooxygenase [Zetaproteobacteria bacterium]|nr:MAG: antibiotic biosynthesis monooxygenase [Zetaproteobacteria bacterium]